VAQVDFFIFRLINQLELLASLEALIILWRNEQTWIPLYVVLIFYFVYKFKKQGIYIVLFAIMSAGFSDYTNSSLLKKSFERPRPCHIYEQSGDINLRVKCGRGFSFPSSHASNHMCLAIFLSFFFKGKHRFIGAILLLWALVVGFAQVYVGVHYPFDVFGGFLWGGIIAISFYRLSRLLPIFKQSDN